MGQERQRPWLVLDVAHEEVDESLLEKQPGLAGRLLDQLAKSVRGDALEQVERVLDQPGQIGVRGQLTDPVGAQGEHDRSVAGVLGHPHEERGPDRLRHRGREDLLALVDHQDRALAAPRRPGRQGLHRSGGRGDDAYVCC